MRFARHGVSRRAQLGVTAFNRYSLSRAGRRFWSLAVERGAAAMTSDAETDTQELEYFFRFRATLRIFGDIGDLEAITAELGVAPTHTHRRGEKPRPNALRAYEYDMWSYSAPVPEDRPLHLHLEALWRIVRPHVAYLKGLRERLSVDVYCNYHTNCSTGGFEVDHRALTVFTELEVPFGVSVGIA